MLKVNFDFNPEIVKGFNTPLLEIKKGSIEIFYKIKEINIEGTRLHDIIIDCGQIKLICEKKKWVDASFGHEFGVEEDYSLEIEGEEEVVYDLDRSWDIMVYCNEFINKPEFSAFEMSFNKHPFNNELTIEVKNVKTRNT